MPIEKESLTIRPVKPPVGIIPRYIRDEKRMNEIEEAITEYMKVAYPIPVEWIKEYNELCQTIKRGRGVN